MQEGLGRVARVSKAGGDVAFVERLEVLNDNGGASRRNRSGETGKS